MEERARESSDQKIEKEAYLKIKSVVDSMDDNDDSKRKLIAAARIFYTLCENNTWKKYEQQFRILHFFQLKPFVLELWGEAVNRDMISYIQTGTGGTVSTQMYDALKSC